MVPPTKVLIEEIKSAVILWEQVSNVAYSTVVFQLHLSLGIFQNWHVFPSQRLCGWMHGPCALLWLTSQAGRMKWGANKAPSEGSTISITSPGSTPYLSRSRFGPRHLEAAWWRCMARRHNMEIVCVGQLLFWAMALHLKASCSQHCKIEIHWLIATLKQTEETTTILCFSESVTNHSMGLYAWSSAC